MDTYGKAGLEYARWTTDICGTPFDMLKETRFEPVLFSELKIINGRAQLHIVDYEQTRCFPTIFLPPELSTTGQNGCSLTNPKKKGA